MKFKFRFLVCLASAVISSQVYANSKADCEASELDLCLYHVSDRRSGEIELYARNIKHHDMSVVVDLNLTNLSNSADEGGFVVNGQTERLLTVLKPIDPYQRTAFQYDTRWTAGDMFAQHDDATIYRLPYAVGPGYYVGQSCEGRLSHLAEHSRYAVDFSLANGTRIHAARGGTVVDLHEVSISGGTSTMHLDKGNYIDIRHDDGTVATYHHLRTMGVRVELGQRVETGEFIGFSGDTGYASSPHLHFGVQRVNSELRTLSIPITWKTKRGEIKCPRPGLNLKAVPVKQTHQN